MVASHDGGRSVHGPLERYPVTPAGVASAGDRLTTFAGDVETLQGDVAGAHGAAQRGVAGLLADSMVAAERPVRRRAERWLKSAMFAGGAVRLFSDAVAAYNGGVDELNQRYREGKGDNFGLSAPEPAAGASEAEEIAAAGDFRAEVAEADRALLAELRRELHAVWEPALDEQADHVAKLLDRGPDDADAVVTLYAAGTLPWTTPFIFQEVDLRRVPPPALPNGTLSAERLQLAMAGELPPEEFLRVMLALQLVTERAEYVQQHPDSAGPLSEAEVAFLHHFYDRLGEDVWRVPDYIRDEQHRWDEPPVNPFGWFGEQAGGFDGATQEWMLEAMGTGLLALSNSELWVPALRGGDPMDPDARYHLPQTVIDLVTAPAVTTELDVIVSPAGARSELLIYDLPRRDDYLALAAMLEATGGEMTGGADFSEQLTVRVAEIAEVVQREVDWSWDGPMPTPGDDGIVRDEADPLLRTLLGVATRNEEANHHLLTGEVQHPEWGDGTAREVLTSLYNFDWSDGGATAAGLTDWISERADHAARQGEYDPAASGAAAALIDLVTVTERGEGHDEPGAYRVDVYDGLMQILSEKNPEVAQSFGRIAASYLSDFSEPSAGTIVEGDGSLSLSDHDKVRFLDLIATDDAAINGLSRAAGVYEQRMLTAALREELAMTEVGQRSSRLDGLLAAARWNADMVGESQRYADQAAAYEEHMRYLSSGRRRSAWRSTTRSSPPRSRRPAQWSISGWVRRWTR